MSYVSLNGKIDFSGGTCGPGMFKPHPKSSCQALPYDSRAPEYGGMTNESPFSLPGGNVGFSRAIQDFSGGSCGAGMIRPDPTAPCQPLISGMSVGDFGDTLKKYGSTIAWGAAAVIGLGIAIKLYKRHTRRKVFALKTRKPGTNKMRSNKWIGPQLNPWTS